MSTSAFVLSTPNFTMVSFRSKRIIVIYLASHLVRKCFCSAAEGTGELSATTLKYLLHDQPIARLDKLYNVSDNFDGMIRLYLGPAHQKAAKLIRGWMLNAGLQTEFDAVANVRGRINGTSNSTRRWITGSHFDAVAGGGKYDGVAGIVLSLAAIEATIAEAGVKKGLVTDEALRERLSANKSLKGAFPQGTDFNSLLNKSIEIIAFAEEEGIRFKHPLGTSSALAGAFINKKMHRLEDSDGISWLEALDDAGFDVKEKDIEALFISPLEVEGYIEAHIEQYDELERKNSPLGVVEGIAGTTHMLVTMTGDLTYRHMGTVPMSKRRDPVVGMAETVRRMQRKCEAVANETQDYVMCGTPYINVFPNNAVNIPQQINFTIGVTAYNNTLKRSILEYAVEMVTEVCKRRGLGCNSDNMLETETVPSSPTVQEALANSSAEALRVLASMLKGGEQPPRKSKSVPKIPTMKTGMARDAQIMGQLHKVCLLHLAQKPH
eukprot:jgi/Botrbrau1/10534/Bobra.7_1s0014.2